MQGDANKWRIERDDGEIMQTFDSRGACMTCWHSDLYDKAEYRVMPPEDGGGVTA